MNRQHSIKTQQKKTSGWKQWPLSTSVITAVTLAVLLAGSVAGYYARKMISENKQRDTWSILFLESEALANRIGQEVAKISIGAADQVFLWNPITKEFSTGPKGYSFAPKELGFDSAEAILETDPKQKFVVFHGLVHKLSIVDSNQRSIRLTPFDTVRLSKLLAGSKRIAALGYIVSREGKMVISNDKSLTPISFESRPLVQKFISSPLSKGIHEFNDEKNRASFGFFIEIPQTNLMLFAESSKSVVLASIRDLTREFVVVLIGILVLVLATISWPILRMTAPLTELANTARLVGGGDLSLRANPAGYGEVSQLGEAFNQMLEGLTRRDHAIASLMKEQTEKVRLQSELKVAQGIQSNLLPQEPMPVYSGVEVAGEYHPATECAGDWYFYHYCVDRKQSIVCVIDVAGHGAGSSMFTALLAGVFDSFVRSPGSSFEAEKLLSEMHERVLRFGRSKWHASAQVLVIDSDSMKMTYLNAGHVPAYIYSGEGSQKSCKRLLGPSDVLGQPGDRQVFKSVINLFEGDSVFMYTDGFTEAKDLAGKVLSAKSIRETFQQTISLPTSQALSTLVNLWQKHTTHSPPVDDACFVVCRIKRKQS